MAFICLRGAFYKDYPCRNQVKIDALQQYYGDEYTLNTLCTHTWYPGRPIIFTYTPTAYKCAAVQCRDALRCCCGCWVDRLLLSVCDIKKYVYKRKRQGRNENGDGVWRCCCDNLHAKFECVNLCFFGAKDEYVWFIWCWLFTYSLVYY